MKNLILGFLVFITILSKGQSVDPETFPTVVGSIGNKNVYTNTGGEGKISVQSILDSAKLISGDFIPLSGTEVGNPVTGDIEFYNSGEDITKYLKFNNATGGFIFGDENEFVSPNQLYLFDGTYFLSISTAIDRLEIAANNPNSKGIGSTSDFTANITDLDYTQKKYVDKKVAKIGTDDIEITDFNKGIILTAPNSSRYRITVDNSGNLITTLIP